VEVGGETKKKKINNAKKNQEHPKGEEHWCKVVNKSCLCDNHKTNQFCNILLLLRRQFGEKVVLGADQNWNGGLERKTHTE
jgi:hypothetical protein